jgi:hypothetical protein
MRTILRLFISANFLFTNQCFCQSEADQYLKFKEAADQFKTYTIAIKDSEIAKYFSSKELRKAFDESFSFLKKNKVQLSRTEKNLNINIIFEDLQVYLPTTQFISLVSEYTGLSKYNVITKYSMTTRLELEGRADSIISIPLCTNKYFDKEKEILIADPNSNLARQGYDSNLAEALSRRRKTYEPDTRDFKNSFLTILDYYRRKVNVR